MIYSPDIRQHEPEEPKKAKKKLTTMQKLKRIAFAGLLGATAGTTAIEADQHLTHGLFQRHLRSFITSPEYREKVGESLTSGEFFGDTQDLFREADRQLKSNGEADASDVLPHIEYLSEKKPITDAFFERYFDSYEIRDVAISEKEGPKRPVFIVPITRPELVNFNIGTDDDPEYDPWTTEEKIGPFVTIPTNASDSETSARTHALYSVYAMDGKTHEYTDVKFTELGQDPRVIRAGALVLFSKDGKNTLLAVDSRGFDLHIGDATDYGTVQAIESYGAAIFSDYEDEDIESMKTLVGTALLPEYTRKNYNSIIVTYTYENKSPQTYVIGLYTNTDNMTTDEAAWDGEEQLTPEDFYFIASQYGKEIGAASTNVLFPDPGPSSNLYDPEIAMGDVSSFYHSRSNIRPQFSIVQKGNR